MKRITQKRNLKIFQRQRKLFKNNLIKKMKRERILIKRKIIKNKIFIQNLKILKIEIKIV